MIIVLKKKNGDWYKNIWSLDSKNDSWVENTETEVDFIVKTLELTGKERILDLACGFGRHSLLFAGRGFSVVGVDITEAFINDARSSAKRESLTAEFIHVDIRDISFVNEFDVVINMGDGAIGYLENDAENLKVFDKIADALKPGGKHFMAIRNAEFAEHCCPRREWEIGENAMAIALLEWDKETRTMLYAGWSFPYGKPAVKPVFTEGDPCRLYSKTELHGIMSQRSMKIINTFSDFTGKEDSYMELSLLVYSKKEKKYGHS